LRGIEQTQVNSEDGYTFANGLRSILRQDPDIILVGEIRDKETAETSINAALTGHLVFSTLHTNNASGAIPRLIDLGIKTESIGPALTLIVAQRLVRRLCEKCRVEIKPDKDTKSKIDKFIKSLPKNIPRESIETRLYKAKGCDNCIDGFRGRTEIAELLRISEEIDTLIRKSVSEGDIEKYATEKQRMLLMQEDGLLKAIRGITTIEEVERVTGPIDW